MRSVRVRLTLAFAAVAVITAAAALNLALVYFERRLAGLPPEVASQVQGRLAVAGGDFDGFRELSAVVAVSLAVGLLSAVVLARWISRPLRALSSAAGRLADGDLAARAQARAGRDEIGQLVSDFNSMAATLQTLEEERRTSSALIAHELRTPLSALTARLQGLRDGVLVWGPAESDRLLRHTTILRRLVEDLRTLSLAEAGRLRLDRRDTDLRGPVSDAVAAHQPLADLRTVRLILRPVPSQPLLARVDADRLGQVLGNLLDNATRHTPVHGAVTASAHAETREIVILVDDEGPGIPPSQRERVFDRFTQLDAVGGAGSGLGLTVVRALVTAEGGSVTIGSAPSGGTRIAVRLPRLDQPR
ncbi:ATP-binding protein [Micromonospora sp. 067-2]|uniref:sensor histidine kinase n=1 Tax=Micromonospora sp. 067-2 TaxID=2789270 RepID=UPI00397BF52B